MDLVRVLRATPYTLQKQYTEGGVNVDPGTVTIGVTAADGTVVVAPGTSTGGTGTGARTFNLTATHTAQLDNLTATWTSASKGTLTSRVEVVGGFLFSLAEARAVKPLENAAYTDQKIADMRTLVEDAFERACGVAFVPRYTRETVYTDGTAWRPSWPLVSNVRSLTVDNVATTGTILAGNGTVYLPAAYGPYQAVTIGYEHGHPYPPPRLARAALFEARYRLLQANSPTDDRAVRLDTEAGSYALQQPGRGGAMFFLPESDEAARQESMIANVA